MILSELLPQIPSQEDTGPKLQKANQESPLLAEGPFELVPGALPGPELSYRHHWSLRGLPASWWPASSQFCTLPPTAAAPATFPRGLCHLHPQKPFQPQSHSLAQDLRGSYRTQAVSLTWQGLMVASSSPLWGTWPQPGSVTLFMAHH